MQGQTDSDDSEYRPTDYLAICRMSYGYGSGKDDAVLNALRYAAPFSNTDDDDTVEVAVWELYADSWQKHGPTGPERDAEQVEYQQWELPVGIADEAAEHASDANARLSSAYHKGEKVREVSDED